MIRCGLKLEPVDILIQSAFLLIDRGGKRASDEKCDDSCGHMDHHVKIKPEVSIKKECKSTNRSKLERALDGSIPKRSLPAGCVRITKRDTLECT